MDDDKTILLADWFIDPDIVYSLFDDFGNFESFLSKLNEDRLYALQVRRLIAIYGRNYLLDQLGKEYDYTVDYYSVGLWRIAWELSESEDESKEEK